MRLFGINNKKKKYLLISIVAVLIIVLLCIVVSALRTHQENATISANISKLEDLEKQSIEKTQKQIENIIAKEKEREKRLSGTDFRKRFAGCVIAGDSITEALDLYGFLDKDVAVYKRGVSVASQGDIIKKTIALKPKIVFLSFGLNDLELYDGDSGGFISAYKDLITGLQKKLPDTKIYVNSIFPSTAQKQRRSPSLSYVGEFNSALKKMCEDLKITFIDNTYLTRQHPEYYEPDGQHFSKAFYPLWLSNMAKKAGI